MEKVKTILKWIILLIAGIFVVLAASVGISYVTRYNYIKKTYDRNSEALELMADEFHSIYSEGLERAILAQKSGELLLDFVPVINGNNIEYPNDVLDWSDSSSLKTLNDIWEQNHADSYYEICYDVTARYDDEGRLMFSIIVKSTKRLTDSAHIEYLVYMDDGYNGIMPMPSMKREWLSENRYKGNWYYWLKHSRIG